MRLMRNKIIIFIISFGVFFLMLHAIVRLQVARQTNIYVEEINSIHTKIEDRFKLFIDAPLAVGITSSAYMGKHYKDNGEYERLAQKVVSSFHELLGLTILEANGKIVRVYPLNDNPGTLGKISQNTEALKISYKKNEAYWLSPPFDLYQGPRGFSFYVPMVKDGELMGWVAPIISVDRFFNKFIKLEFLETFHLVIQDVQTNENYFSTNELPKNKKKLHTNYAQIRGREMRFLSWKKEKSFSDHDHWPFTGLLSLILGLIAVYCYWLFEQKNLSTKKLEDINALLNVTSNDTSVALDGIQHQLELMKQGSVPVSLERIAHYVASITNMVQQITVLQRISIPGMAPSLQKTDLLHLMKEVSENYKNVLVPKNMFLEIPENQFVSEVLCNKWLMCHSVLGNILTYIASIGNKDSMIKVRLSHESVTFSFEGQVTPEVLKGNLEHGLFVARQVMNIHQGSLVVSAQTIEVKFQV